MPRIILKKEDFLFKATQNIMGKGKREFAYDAKLRFSEKATKI
jgi:hypothetical protein